MDMASDASRPRNTGFKVEVFAAIAQPLPPISSSHTFAHLARRVADELALLAPPLLLISRGGATYFDSG